jgi:hypothetical protein
MLRRLGLLLARNVKFYYYSNQTGSSTCLECPRKTASVRAGASSVYDCLVQNCTFLISVVQANDTVFYDNISSKNYGSIGFLQASELCSKIWHGGTLPIASSPAQLDSIPLSLGTPVWLGAIFFCENSSTSVGFKKSVQMTDGSPWNSSFLPSSMASCPSNGQNFASCGLVNLTSSGQRTINPSRLCLRDRFSFMCAIKASDCTARVSCGIGSFVDISNSSNPCLQCPTGRFQNISNSASCRICPQGKFTDKAGQSVCSTCPIRTFSIQEGQSTCFLCSPGTFGTTEGASVCQSCPIGTFQPEAGSSGCNLCKEGEYSSSIGSVNCTKCGIGILTTGKGAISLQDCSLCDVGFYGQPPGTLCTSCPVNIAGLACPINSSLPVVSSGYYRAGSSGAEVSTIYSCSPQEVCVRTGTDASTTCLEGYTGFICGQCADNYYRSNECKACPNSTMKWLTIISFICVACLATFRIVSSSRGIPTDIKLLLQACQIIALYPSINGKWPKSILRLFQLLSFTVRPAFVFQL